MPIIGATDRESAEFRFPVIGRLAKGDPKGEKTPGKERPFFRFVGHEDLSKAFEEAFGKEPRSLRVYLPYPGAEGNFSSWVELWRASRLIWRADGENTVRQWMSERKTYSDRPEDQIPMPDDAEAKWTGRLNVIIPELFGAGGAGVVLLRTTGKHDCVRLARTLFALERTVAKREHGLQGMEVVIYREQVEHTTPDGPRRKHWDVFLKPAVNWVAALIGQAQERAMLGERAIDPETGEIGGEPPREEEGNNEGVQSADSGDSPSVEGQAVLPSEAWIEAALEVTPKNWTEFYERAVEELDFSHRKHASNVVKELGQRRPAIKKAWVHLCEHQRAKLIPTPEDPQGEPEQATLIP